jgi:hypothetical protein
MMRHVDWGRLVKNYYNAYAMAIGKAAGARKVK